MASKPQLSEEASKPQLSEEASKPQLSQEAFKAIAGMSKSQLYDILSNMKHLIDTNPQQARQVLVDQPDLTKTLLQAQIMLGMVKPSQPCNIQQVLSQLQSARSGHQSDVQTTQPFPTRHHQGQTSSSQPVVSAWLQHPPQPTISQPSVSLPSSNFPSQLAPSPQLYQQTRGNADARIHSISAPQSSQNRNLHLPPSPASPRYPNFQPHMSTIPNQAHPSLQMPGAFNQPQQPPLPQQPRPSTIQPFQHQHPHQHPHPHPHPHQHHSQMSHLGFQPGAPQQHLSQPMFHSGSNHAPSFPQGQPPLPSQPPPQHLYQGRPHIGSDYNNQVSNSMQLERGHWVPGPPERPTSGANMQGSGSGQLPHPPPLSHDREQALFQQVLSLTPEQINLLPPEQRQQVFQLRNMLRPGN